MSWRIDPHTHSCLSDGSDTPAEMLKLARQAELDVLGVSDHDTFDHWPIFRQAHRDALQANQQPPALLLGTEISAFAHQTSVHLLVFLSDPARGNLNQILQNVRQQRLERLRAMTEKLRPDYPLSWSEVTQQIPGLTPGRPHLADALVQRGYFPSRAAAFQAVLNPGSPYYARRPRVDAFEVVEAARADGGVPIVAHPFAPLRGNSVLDAATVRELAAAGILGIEVWHREMDAAGRELALDLCRELDLIASGGSDYHGTGKPNRLGENTLPPEGLARIIELGVSEIVGQFGAN